MSYPLTGLNQDPPPLILYHYTSQVGLIGITSRKQIWATNISYLNDTSEFRHGEEVIRQVVEKRRRSAQPDQKKFFEDLEKTPSLFEDSSFFIASLTEEEDLLSQWRGYTPNANGFSVGFDSRLFSQLMIPGSIKLEFELIKCVYNETQQREMAEEVLDTTLSTWDKRNESQARRKGRKTVVPFRIYPPAMFKIGASFLAPVFKSSQFSEEREWRLIGICRSPNSMKFRQGTSMILPYIEVSLSKAANELEISPIVSVTVGPCPNPELSRRSAKWLLESEGIVNASVSSSRVPYRGW